ncbi:MAG TPA: hypothetical protein VGX28_15530 [Frankiaceae bacterium]|jgi:hypothetical protein|nr:hypothetical protein [Frankiaceae bacterium]
MDDVLNALRRVDSAPVRPLDTAALRERAARNARRGRLATAGGAALAVAAAAAAFAIVRQEPRPVVPATPLACPGERPPAGVGPADAMVSDGAIEVLVCERTFRTAARGPVTLRGGDPLARRIVTALRAVRREDQVSGLHGCMLDLIGDYGVALRYDDHVEVVTVNPDGCAGIDNGTWRTIYPKVSVAPLLDEALAPTAHGCRARPALAEPSWPASAPYVPGPVDTMVPDGTVAVHVCRYQGYLLAATATVTDSTATRIVDGLNAVGLSHGARDCSNTSETLYNVLAERADGSVTTVAVSHDGCRYVTNGTRLGSDAPDALLDLLAEAVTQG